MLRPGTRYDTSAVFRNVIPTVVVKIRQVLEFLQFFVSISFLLAVEVGNHECVRCDLRCHASFRFLLPIAMVHDLIYS